MIKQIVLFFISILFMIVPAEVTMAQVDDTFSIARIQYRGGGDWYNDPSALTNLINYTKEQIQISIRPEYDDVQLGSRDLQNYPYAFLTGHGSIVVNNAETENLRRWLNQGGFLHIDDDYGLDEDARKLIDRIYPGAELIEVPFTHPIYNIVFDMSDGLPKVHEHDGLPPRGFGVFHEGRMVIFYTFESNPSDAWANPEIHDPSPAIRQKALQMGANILVYALTQI